MIYIETACFGLAALGALSHLNDMTRATWRQVAGFALVAAGCAGCALEPLFGYAEPIARLVLAAGLALVALPILRRDVRLALGHPPRMDRRQHAAGEECAAPEGGMPHFERRFESRQ